MRRAALMMIGLTLAGCSSAGGRDKAESPATTAVPGPAASSSTVPGIQPAGEASPPPSTPLGSGSSPNGSNGTPGAPGGSAAATGGPGVGTGSGAGAGAAAAATGGSGQAGTDAPSPAGGGEPSGSVSPPTSIDATPEQCAALRQLLAIVDHPDVRRLATQAGCI